MNIDKAVIVGWIMLYQLRVGPKIGVTSQRQNAMEILTTKKTLVVVCIFITISPSKSQCPSSLTSCSCRARYVDCNNRNINRVPGFPSDATFSINYNRLDLSNNHIRFLGNGTFRNSGFKEIYLSNNSLTTFDGGSFHEVKSTLIFLDLSHNNISFLPTDLSELERLETLDVSNNPLRKQIDFTSDVLRSLGDSLLDFRFGGQKLDEWPSSLHHLPILQRLTIAGASPLMKVIPPTGFHGFETTLLFLRIENTHLQAVPLGVSKLKHLKEFHFDKNPYVRDIGILIQSFPTQSMYLETLSLNGDSLTQFPVVLKYLRGLRNLSLDDNVLEFLSDTNIGDLRTITNVTLRNCSLLRIPGSLQDIRYLSYLDLSSNDIQTIDKNDLQDLRYLEHFVLSNSSLRYISEDALGRVPRLKVLDFNKTKLTHVPKAIEKVWPCLQNVFLDDVKIDCMCETLVWLREKRDRCRNETYPISIHGQCDTIHDTVENYIEKYIPKCPEYQFIHNIPPYNH